MNFGDRFGEATFFVGSAYILLVSLRGMRRFGAHTWQHAALNRGAQRYVGRRRAS